MWIVVEFFVIGVDEFFVFGGVDGVLGIVGDDLVLWGFVF